jgi:type II secretory pathway pseudopilin PulG
MERVMQHRNRNGLSALDVIVTIVILLVLAALLLPALQTTRCTSNYRSQFKNNLKMIGLALHNYHDAHRSFPPGWIVSESHDQSSGFGWGYHILPFSNQAPLFKKFNSHAKLSDKVSGNADLAAHILTFMRCPADNGPDQAESRSIPLLGTANYVGNFGVGIPASTSRLDEYQGRIANPRAVQGIFGGNTKVRTRDVKDGMSNVIFVGERRQSTNGAEWPNDKLEGHFNHYWAGIPNVGTVSPLVIVATSTGGEFEGKIPAKDEEWTGLPLTGNLQSLEIPQVRKSLPYFKINHNANGQPLSTSKTNSTAISAGLSSWHTGGCQVVLGDGTVRFLSENIDPIVFTNLMRRSDGKTIGEF